jgi:hypothetical protein
MVTAAVGAKTKSSARKPAAARTTPIVVQLNGSPEHEGEITQAKLQAMARAAVTRLWANPNAAVLIISKEKTPAKSSARTSRPKRSGAARR